MCEQGAGGREVGVERFAEVSVGDAREQRCWNTEASETGGDVEAGPARTRVVATVGRKGE